MGIWAWEILLFMQYPEIFREEWSIYIWAMENLRNAQGSSATIPNRADEKMFYSTVTGEIKWSWN